MRCWVGAVVLSMVGLLAGDVLARSRDSYHYRADLANGKVTALTAPSITAPPTTSPRVGRPFYARYDKGVVSVLTAAGWIKLALPVGKLDHEWMPWSILQPGVLVFAWRERGVVPGKADTYLDVVRGVDLDSGRELWRRDTPGSYAGAIGDRLIVLHGGAGSVDLVESRTGRTLRRVAIGSYGPSVLPIAGGDTLVDLGDGLARLDGNGSLLWQAAKLGTVTSVTPLAHPTTRYEPTYKEVAPLPATGEWIVLMRGRIARMDAVTGKVGWSRPTTTTSFLVDGGVLVATDLPPARSTSRASVKILVLDLATGATTREILLPPHLHFFDAASAFVGGKQGNDVEVRTEFIVLD